MKIDAVPLTISFLVAYVLVLRVWPAREGLFWFLMKAGFAFAVYYASHVFLLLKGVEPEASIVFAVFLAIAGFTIVPARSRHIPRRVRRAVIARDLKGAKFDHRKHHVDHIWPFARGGSHKADNLRVISKAANLRKGKKKPRLRDWRWF